MIELLFADCNCQSLTKKFPLRCQKFPHSSQISSQISVGFANFVDMGLWKSTLLMMHFPCKSICYKIILHNHILLHSALLNTILPFLV